MPSDQRERERISRDQVNAERQAASRKLAARFAISYRRARALWDAYTSQDELPLDDWMEAKGFPVVDPDQLVERDDLESLDGLAVPDLVEEEEEDEEETAVHDVQSSQAPTAPIPGEGEKASGMWPWNKSK